MTLRHSSKGMLWFWLLVFLCTRPGLCFFFFHPVGAAFPPCRGFVSVLFAFLLSGLTSPLLPPSIGLHRSPPPEVRLRDSNRSPFGFVLTNPTPYDAPPFLQRDALVLVTGLFYVPGRGFVSFFFFHPRGMTTIKRAWQGTASGVACSPARERSHLGICAGARAPVFSMGD